VIPRARLVVVAATALSLRVAAATVAASSPRVGAPLPELAESQLSPRQVTEERFAAYVAHELRTPLATQRALLELTLADPSADVSMWREIGEDVLGACRQQERLLEACLALARSQGKPQRYEPVDLATVAAEALRAHDLSGLESVVVLEPAWTTGDPDLLERTAANLVSNAVRHNVVGGRIEVTTRAESRRAHLMVANTGPLVPAAELERLFEPFQRLNTSRDGVGLGLAIVQAIADAHDATVSAQARTNGGLGIDVAFPALD
jgi:signal transduction histidine kinase